MAQLHISEPLDKAELRESETHTSLTEVEMLPLAKETMEKLTLLNDSYTRKLDKLIEHIENSQKDYDASASSQEQYIHLKSIIGRIQLGSYNAHLLITLGEYLRLLEKRRGKLRYEAKRLSEENSALRQSIQAMQSDIYREEAELTVAQEEVHHWMFMNNIAKADAADAVDNEALDAWISTLFPEIRYKVYNQGDKPAGKETIHEFTEVQSMMTDNLLVGNVAYAERAIKMQISQHDVHSDREAQVLIWLAKHCADRSCYDKAIDLMTQALDLRIQVFGEHNDNVIKIRNFLALIHWRNNSIAAAALCAYTGLCSYEKQHKNFDNRDTAIQCLRVGYLFVKMQCVNEGVKAMELSMRTLELLLPREEVHWLAAATALIRTCNDIGAHLNALALCCEVIDYFYVTRFGLISAVNTPVYEVAAWHQVCASTYSEPPEAPAPVNLPEAMVGIIRELTIIFIQFYFFTGTKVLDSWLDECSIIPPNPCHRLSHLEEIHRFNFTKDSGENKLGDVRVNHEKREGWVDKALETIELRNLELINKCDVLETWSEATFQKTRKKIHAKFHSKAADILKKAKKNT